MTLNLIATANMLSGFSLVMATLLVAVIMHDFLKPVKTFSVDL